jgi:hypothetical protein
VCGAVYNKRRWIPAGAVNEETERGPWHLSTLTVCPACKQKREGSPRGYLFATGAFLAAHPDEIVHLLQNEAGRAATDNPLGRIMSFQADESGVSVTTTTEHLAERLGQALEKAFGGEVRYDFSHENKLARVYWNRD